MLYKVRSVVPAFAGGLAVLRNQYDGQDHRLPVFDTGRVGGCLQASTFNPKRFAASFAPKPVRCSGDRLRPEKTEELAAALLAPERQKTKDPEVDYRLTPPIKDMYERAASKKKRWNFFVHTLVHGRVGGTSRQVGNMRIIKAQDK